MWHHSLLIALVDDAAGCTEEHMLNAAHKNAERALVNIPEYWLGRANVVRAEASSATDAILRRHLLGCAEGYEQTARHVATLLAQRAHEDAVLA